MKKYDLIVIGAGPGGITVARFTKSLRKEWNVLIIRKQKKSVIPCALPYAIDGTVKVDDYIKNDEKLLKSAGIDLLIDEVEEIDCENKQVKIKNGEKFNFRYLVIATGSIPFIPLLPGRELKNIFTIKDHPDILNILDVIGNVKKAVVVGAGFIGLEMVNAFANRGIEITLVEKENCCLPAGLSRDLTGIITDKLKEKGVKLYLGKLLKKIEGEGKVERCILEDGTVIKTDIVVLSIGVKPEISLAEKAGIETNPGGIIVNDFLQTNKEGIYAIGDCILKKSFITGKYVPGYLATNAVVEARYAVLNILNGNKFKFPGVVNPVITKIFDLSCGATGLTKDMAERENIEIITSDADVFTKEKSFPGAEFLKIRFIFEKEKLQLIGVEAISKENVAWLINMFTLAIFNKNTAFDLTFSQFCGHPPQIDVPSKTPFVTASIDVLKKAGRI